MTFHGSLFYFAARYGLQVTGVVQPVPGTEPTAQHLAALMAELRGPPGAALFTEPQMESQLAVALAREAGVSAAPGGPARRRAEGGELRGDRARDRPGHGRGAAMTPALRARGVTVDLGGRRVLDDVSFDVERGEFACLCGPNGGGKTTILKAALGLVPLAAGEIEVLGARPGAAGSAVGYLPQVEGLQPDVPGARGGRDRGEPAAGAGRCASRRPTARRPAPPSPAWAASGSSTPRLRGLSGGELQRAYLARALVNEPALLLLDEPTAGVDARGRAEFLDLLAGVAAREDLAAVLVTHNAATVRRLARRVVYLDGRVRAWGEPAEVLDREWDKAAFSGHDHDAQPGPLLRGRVMGELLDALLTPLAQGFVRRALGAGLALGAAGALLGVFIVQRGLGLLSDGLAHATFGGLALGLLLGATVDRAIWVALPFTVAIALGIQYVRRRTTLGGDVATGVFFAVSFAAGILFLGLRSSRSAPVNVEGLLFGSLLAVSPEALAVILGVAALVVAVLFWVGPAPGLRHLRPRARRALGGAGGRPRVRCSSPSPRSWSWWG